MEHIVIIGNGISGITAARHIRKLSDKKITVVSAETDYFFSRTALMYVYMGHMKFDHIQPYEHWFWKKNRIGLVRGYVTQVNTDEKKLTLDESRTLTYDKLVIATGSKSNKFGWPGQDLLGVQGLYSKQDLDQLEADAPNAKICKRAVIVGGGLNRNRIGRNASKSEYTGELSGSGKQFLEWGFARWGIANDQRTYFGTSYRS